jgi:serine/threonine protein kinase
MLADTRQRARVAVTQMIGLSRSDRLKALAACLPEDPQSQKQILSLLDLYDAGADEPKSAAGDLAALENASVDESAPASDLLNIGDVHGPYRVLRQIGSGGMGRVFLAEDVRLHRHVALKSLAGKWLDDPNAHSRLLREARAVAALAHPNIAALYDVLEEAGQLLLVMENVEGRTLKAVLEDGPMPLGQALRIGIQVVGAIGYAHDRGVIHCDLKPTNIQVTDDGIAKILDFGLARIRYRDLEPSGNLTLPGATLGTPGYVAPERLFGVFNASGDIYSLGIVLFEMFTGRRLFDPRQHPEHWFDVVNGQPVKPSAFVAELPAAVDDVIQRALSAEPSRRHQSAQELGRDLQAILATLDTRTLAVPAFAPVIRQRPWRLITGAAVVVLALLGILMSQLTDGTTAPPATGEPVFTRLTSSAGLSTNPAFSADGTLMAYSSDASSDGNLDIWVRQVAGGEAVQLTSHPADDSDPSFSPDNTTIAFRSERDGGGIYLVPALGGNARLVARDGHQPRFSSDGKWMAYSRGSIGASFLPGSSRVFIVSTSGGEPRDAAPILAAAHHAIWTPDGNSLLLLGRSGGSLPRDEAIDWWMVPLDGGPATKTGALAAIRNRKLIPALGQGWVAPEAWTSDRSGVLFAAMLGDSTNIWELTVSPKTRQISGQPRQRTFGTGIEIGPSPAMTSRGKTLAFSSLSSNVDLWVVPINAEQGKATGVPKRLTADLSTEFYPSIAIATNKLVFATMRSGNSEIRVRDLATDRETVLASSRASVRQPKISADGSTVVFWEYDRDKLHGAVLAVPTDGGVPVTLCQMCGPPTSLSADGRTVVLENAVSPAPPVTLGVLDVVARKQIGFVRPDGHGMTMLYGGRLSPDAKWMALHGASPNSPLRRIFIAPLIARSSQGAWIPITDGSAQDREAEWSPEGNVLYFLSDRDGFRCVWAQRLEPETKQPIDQAFAVHHFHHARLSLTSLLSPAAAGLSLTGDRMIVALRELTGNIWLATNPPEPPRE